MTSKDNPTLYITSAQELETLCSQLASAPFLAIDTEFVRDKTYYPKLCLLQIAGDDIVACIDPLSINDLSALKELLFANSKTKIFHAARQDLEIFYLIFNALPTPLFDTQIAATLLGLGEQIGYANLVKHYLNIDVPKGQARADWEQRPLSQEQMEYAANDVRYLLEIYPVILQKLTSLDRADWLSDDFDELASLNLYKVEPEQQWQRISGQQKLKGVQLAVLQMLAAWRENLAQQQNKPRKWILPDNLLLTIAMQAPAKLDKLSRIRGLNQTIISRHGHDIIKLIVDAKSLPESQWPKLIRRNKLAKNQEALLDAVMAVVKIQAAKHDISTGAITSKSELEKLVGGERDIPLLHGWRHGIAGQQVLDYLNGKTSLQYKDKELRLISIS